MPDGKGNGVMTEYGMKIQEGLVYPECPYADNSWHHASKEVICSKSPVRGSYCSTLNQKGECPLETGTGTDKSYKGHQDSNGDQLPSDPDLQFLMSNPEFLEV
jgi:hypothetical protein